MALSKRQSTTSRVQVVNNQPQEMGGFKFFHDLPFVTLYFGSVKAEQDIPQKATDGDSLKVPVCHVSPWDDFIFQSLKITCVPVKTGQEIAFGRQRKTF